jgi:hypothetical protein
MFGSLQFKKNLKNDLLNFKEVRLTSASIALLVILDILIFIVITVGIETEISKTPKSYYYYPSNCTQHFDNIKRHYYDFDNAYYTSNNDQNSIQSQYCKELNQKIDILVNQKTFITNFKSIRFLNDKTKQNNKYLSQISEHYNTRLFETIANTPNNKALNDIKIQYDAIILDNKNIKKELNSIVKLSSIDEYNDYVNYIHTNKDSFNKEKVSYIFWQPFKTYIYILMFLLPLLLFFGFFYYTTKKKQLMKLNYNPVIKIISANITFLLLIHFIWYTFILIYRIIPHTFFKDMIELFESMGLMSILNYMMIALVVSLFGGIIYYIQKRTLAIKQSLPKNIKKQKLISFSKCFNCEFKINYQKEHCPFCGITLYTECKNCKIKKIIYEPYCSSCGDETIQNNKTTN